MRKERISRELRDVVFVSSTPILYQQLFVEEDEEDDFPQWLKNVADSFFF